MQGAILGLFGVSIAAAVLELLLPGDGSGMKGTLRVLMALAVLLLLLTPFTQMLRNVGDFSLEFLAGESESELTQDFEKIFSDAVAHGSARDLKAGIMRLLQEEYGVAEDEASVLVYFEETGELGRIEIFLSGAALLQDPYELQKDLTERFSCKVEVR